MASTAADSKRLNRHQNSSIICEINEYNQSGHKVATYVNTENENEDGSRIDVLRPESSHSSTKTYAKRVLNAFLPAGYPSSVSSDYLEYQIYDSLQAFSSAIAGLLASRAVLEGIGVGDTTASPTAALLLSILQDSMGRIATIVFAHRLGTSLEPECKMYRLAADIFNDAAMVLDCLSPAFPKGLRVGILSLSSVLRALCGVAAGSSKASLSAHFALNRNLGELNAKDSSQETIISLMGMLTGSLVVSRISSQPATWAAMIILLSIHLSTNYLAVRAVNMRTLNRQRANIVLSNYLAECEHEEARQSESKDIDSSYLNERLIGYGSKIMAGTVLSPEQASKTERIFERDGVLRWRGNKLLSRCRLGVDLKTILDSVQRHNSASNSYSSIQVSLTDLLKPSEERYIIWLDVKRNVFLITLQQQDSDKEPVVKLLAWLHALRTARLIQKETILVEKMPPDQVLKLLERTRAKGQDMDALISRLEFAGWNTRIDALETRAGTRLSVGRTVSINVKKN